MRKSERINKKAASRLVSAAPDLLAVLEEFVADIEAVGVQYLVGNGVNALAGTAWPDIVVTYRKPVRAIKKARGTRHGVSAKQVCLNKSNAVSKRHLNTRRACASPKSLP